MPGLLFNLTDGKPYVIGSAHQLDLWLPSTQFFVGKDKYFANFMVQLPFLMPTSVLPRFRSHVANLHKDKGDSFDSAFKWFSKHGPWFKKTQIAHTTIGNYMWAYEHDEVHWALEWTNHTPIPRVGVHISYTQAFRVATDHKSSAPRVIKAYVQEAALYAHVGVCHALPTGELSGCDDVNRPQRHIWQYGEDWYDWPAIKKKMANATIVYDQYRSELACIMPVCVGRIMSECYNAGNSGAARGAASGGAELGGAESEGAGSGGAEPEGAEPGGAEPGGAEPEGVEPGGAESEGAESGGAEPRGTASGGAAA
ncbi:unnamed protein product [Closterium sp. NIES-54]